MQEIVKIHECSGGITRRFTMAEWERIPLDGAKGYVTRRCVLLHEQRTCPVCGSAMGRTVIR